MAIGSFTFREKRRQKRRGVHSKNSSRGQNGYKKKYRRQGRK